MQNNKNHVLTRNSYYKLREKKPLISKVKMKASPFKICVNTIIDLHCENIFLRAMSHEMSLNDCCLTPTQQFFSYIMAMSHGSRSLRCEMQ